MDSDVPSADLPSAGPRFAHLASAGRGLAGPRFVRAVPAGLWVPGSVPFGFVSMSRSFTYTAQILSVRQSGESNREATILTAEEGILRATVFGGPKSKLRAAVSPYHRGKLWLYVDPVRNSRKITDFEVLDWRPGIREAYHRIMACAVIAEAVLAGDGGAGSWTEALTLVDQSFRELETAAEEPSQRLVLLFLWRWLALLGALPEQGRCGACGRIVSLDENLYYVPPEGAFLCTPCYEKLRRPSVQGCLLGSGARRWIRSMETVDLRSSVRYTMDSVSLVQTRDLVAELTFDTLGKRLVTWYDFMRT